MLVSYDLSQIELRVAALLSGEPALLRAYQHGEDLHTTRTVQLFGEDHLIAVYGPDFRKHPDFRAIERQLGKTVGFADLYRAGWRRIKATAMEKLGLDLADAFCQNIERSRPIVRPGLWAWQESLIESVRRNHRLELPILGHSRFFEGDVNDHINEIVNFPVQATAANFMSFVQIHIHRYLDPMALAPPGRQIHITANVYDALYFDVAPSHLSRLDSIFAEAVQSVTTTGYWAELQALTGNVVPVAYERTTHHDPSDQPTEHPAP